MAYFVWRLLLLFSSISVGVTVPISRHTSCIDRIHGTEAPTGVEKRAGGYERVFNPEWNAAIVSIVKQSEKDYNKENADDRIFMAYGITEAYTQIVAGTNYCVQYMAEVEGVKGGFPVCPKNEKRICVVEVFQPLTEKFPVVKEGSVSCKEYRPLTALSQ